MNSELLGPGCYSVEKEKNWVKKSFNARYENERSLDINPNKKRMKNIKKGRLFKNLNFTTIQ